jgi:hypothetical protein
LKGFSTHALLETTWTTEAKRLKLGYDKDDVRKFIMQATPKVVITTVALTLISAVCSPISSAQESPTSQLLRSKTVLEAFDRAYFKNEKNFYGEMTWKRQVADFFNFFPPENEIAWDAQRVNALYNDVVRQQALSNSYLRVRDLPNPYCQSLQGTPQACGLVPENPLPSSFQAPILPPVNSAPASPTPAMW